MVPIKEKIFSGEDKCWKLVEDNYENKYDELKKMEDLECEVESMYV